jgi:hypothetical protein
MTFYHQPILSDIKALYSKPISPKRFEEYLAMLQGDTKDDMALPIVGFNPMAKDHVLEKIAELESLGAEDLITDVLAQVNESIQAQSIDPITVVINVADDLMGAWTNHYTTDYDSKFKLGAFVSRKFCVPHFWTSELYSVELIESRVRSYVFRMQYLLNHAAPVTLAGHVDQEVYVARHARLHSEIDQVELDSISRFYNQHRDSDDYSLIFNFFYGDEASSSLGYRTYGIGDITGFQYAIYLSSKIGLI